MYWNSLNGFGSGVPSSSGGSRSFRCSAAAVHSSDRSGRQRVPAPEQDDEVRFRDPARDFPAPSPAGPEFNPTSGRKRALDGGQGTLPEGNQK